MKLYLIRHGETDVNRIGGRFQGRIEVPLNEKGIAQAKAAGEEFRRRGISFQHVISSPQGRAMQTAELASGFPREKIIQEERLYEQDFGHLEGHVWEEMNPMTFYALIHEPMSYMPPRGMESVLSVLKRTSRFLEEMRTREKDFPGNVLVSGHGGSLRGILCAVHVMDPNRFWDEEMGNCAWYELTLEHGGFRLTDRSS